MTQTNTEIVRFTMRLERPLYEKITKISKENKRSIAQEIAYRLENSFKK